MRQRRGAAERSFDSCLFQQKYSALQETGDAAILPKEQLVPNHIDENPCDCPMAQHALAMSFHRTNKYKMQPDSRREIQQPNPNQARNRNVEGFFYANLP
jgi:hypothetical protein